MTLLPQRTNLLFALDRIVVVDQLLLDDCIAAVDALDCYEARLAAQPPTPRANPIRFLVRRVVNEIREIAHDQTRFLAVRLGPRDV